MDFESLIGSSAYLAKQLELRWFYHWERASCHISTASSSTADANTNDDVKRSSTRSRRRDVDDSSGRYNGLASFQRLPMEGRLVRKRCHSMPFLRRNMIGHSSCSWDGSRRRPAGGADNVIKNNDTRKNAAASSQKRVSEAAPPKKNGKRKRAGETHYSKDSKRARGKNSTMTATTNLQSNQSSDPSSSFAAFQSYIQSPMERRKILEKIPVELHHDEAFILERMKETWLEEEATGCHRSENSKGSGDGGSKFDDDTSKKGQIKATSYSNDTNHQIKNGRNKMTGSQYESFKGSTGITLASPLTNCVANASMILPSKDVFPSLLEAGASRLGSTTLQNQHQLPPAYFHYLYMQPNNVPATFVEEIDGRTCPLCNFDGKSNEGLLRHCGRYHGMLLDTNISPPTTGGRDCAYFESALGEEGQFHVIIRGLPMHSSHTMPSTRIHKDFVFIKSRSCTPGSSVQKPINRQATIPFLQRHPHKTASLDGATRSKKLLALQANDAPASVISAYLPSDTVPLRQYFHARTNLPMAHGEWMEDSDGETDDTWLHEMSSELLDEFEDVSGNEKKFMKLWNNFIKSDHVIADRDVPGKCHEFVLEHRRQLYEGGLRLNLLLHLFNLWDSGVISSSRILSSMSMFDGAGNDGAAETRGN